MDWLGEEAREGQEATLRGVLRRTERRARRSGEHCERVWQKEHRCELQWSLERRGTWREGCYDQRGHWRPSGGLAEVNGATLKIRRRGLLPSATVKQRHRAGGGDSWESSREGGGLDRPSGIANQALSCLHQCPTMLHDRTGISDHRRIALVRA